MCVYVYIYIYMHVRSTYTCVSISHHISLSLSLIHWIFERAFILAHAQMCITSAVALANLQPLPTGRHSKTNLKNKKH